MANEQSQFTCEYCGEKFSHKSSLKVHIKRHGDEVKINCSDCGYTGSKDLLRRHIKGVHGGKHNCPFCTKEFSKLSNVQQHINQIHEFLKFACDVCNKQFSSKQKMEHHKSKYFTELYKTSIH